MPFDGNGLFTQLRNWVNDKANGIKVTASRFQETYDDMATGFSNCITRDGQSPPTTDIPMGGFQITGLADGVLATDAATVGQVPSLAAAETFYDAGNTGTALTIDWSNGRNQKYTLTNNATITLGNGVSPGWYTLQPFQDATGGRTTTWDGTGYSASRWIGNNAAPILSTVLSTSSIVRLFWDGSVWYMMHAGAVARDSTYFTRMTRATSTQTVTTGLSDVVIFNSTGLDTYSEWNTGTGVFTAKVSGLYQLSFSVIVNVVTGGNTISVYPIANSNAVAGTTYVPTTLNGQDVAYRGLIVWSLSAGQTMYVILENNTSGNAVIKIGSSVQVSRIGDI